MQLNTTEVLKLRFGRRTENLNINHNNINDISNVKFGDIQTINCNDNKLVTLKFTARHVVRMICCNNNITRIEKIDAPKMKVLDISNNPLDTFEDFDNKEKYPVLEILWISTKQLPYIKFAGKINNVDEEE